MRENFYAHLVREISFRSEGARKLINRTAHAISANRSGTAICENRTGCTILNQFFYSQSMINPMIFF